MSKAKLPPFIDFVIIPLINLFVALVIAGIIIALIGENPWDALIILLEGAFIYPGSLGYTLYYTTGFIFTGLAVAVAFHANLFNIGGEGQGMFGGLGVALACLGLAPYLPPFIVVIIAIFAAILFGAFWGFIPGWLQAKRGSHIVITTIMFNFIAASIMVALLTGPLKAGVQTSPETATFAEGISLIKLNVLLGLMGIKIAPSPLNISFFIALIACIFVWVLIWRTKLGYTIRSSGSSLKASIYAGHRPQTIIIIVMSISGGLAGMLALNEVLGVQHKLILEFTAGYGFTGIAVALMGRNHPIGIILASLLFGALYQGGAELDFNFQSISRDFVLIVQGLIILFSGALAFMFNPYIEKFYLYYKHKMDKA